MAPTGVDRTCSIHMANANNAVIVAAQLPAMLGDTLATSAG